ncbi:glycosyltransferase [Candidatus Woesearchaeota archaeon]|nr:glycosyltransferase [Candidatus Woesearchaeota archaeon]
MTEDRISIIVPTFNEAENIERLFLIFKKISKKLGDYEIIIADSSSKDNTKEKAEEKAKEMDLNVKTVNCGDRDLSNSVVYALEKAKGDIIGIMDADLQHPPEMIPKMADKLKENDIVIASRFVKGSEIRFGLKRLFISKVYRLLSYLFVPKVFRIKDPASGFFVFKRKILKNVKLNPIGFKILLEILAKADYKDVEETGFKFRGRKKGESNFNLKQSILAFKHLLRLYMSEKEHFRFLKFCIVGGSGIIVNEGLLFLLTEFFGLYYLFSGIFSIEASILTNFFLNNIWTFKDKKKGSMLKKLGKFNLARIFGLAINFGILWGLTYAGMHYLLSNLVGIIIATVFTYISSIWWVWENG